MTHCTGGGRRRRAGPACAAALAAALAGTALLSAACGGGPAAPNGAAGTAVARALAWARCLRSHGAPNFPDPNSSGAFIVNPSDSSRFDAPQHTRTACNYLRPHGGQAARTPAEQAQQQRKSLEFVACMHRDGFPNLPDGWSGNVGQLKSAGIDPGSPLLAAALKKCGPW
jgi:hypothetical protein